VLGADAERTLKPKDIFRECAADREKDYCPQMIVVPAGSFLMGSPPSEASGRNLERPQHTVTIARPLAVSVYESTFDEWDACVAYGVCDSRVGDSRWGRGQRPVINVTWDLAKQYAAWLTRLTGKPYRLLTEAEYEYATRAGTTTAYPWGNDIGENKANCTGCGSRWDGKQTAPVGSFAPNQFNLYDMVGNVWEWTEDCVHDSYNGAPTDGSAWIEGGDCTSRIVRGGAWSGTPSGLRSAGRGASSANDRGYGLGFRVARTLTP
jgi:formylglycine-generating enzyme required for sulfatase activity